MPVKTFPNAKLTEVQVREIRDRYPAGREPQSSIATRYGINQKTVSAIVLGRSWKHVTGGVAITRKRYAQPVPDRDDEIMAALTRAWRRIRAEDPRVPATSFYLTGGRSSTCATLSFEEDDPVLRVNLQRDGRNLAGAELMEWLLHNAAHAAGGSSSGSEGRWHTKAFADAAAGLGMKVEEGRAGLGQTSMTRDTVTRYAPEIAALDAALSTWEPQAARARPRGPERYQCSCEPPRTLRVNPGVAGKGGILCEVCGQPFTQA